MKRAIGKILQNLRMLIKRLSRSAIVAIVSSNSSESQFRAVCNVVVLYTLYQSVSLFYGISMMRKRRTPA